LKTLPTTLAALAGLLLAGTCSSRATTIAAVVTPDNIVIAADSLVTKESAKGPEGFGFAQKIEEFGSTVVAAGGLAKAGNNLFDVFQVAGEACRSTFGANAQAQMFASKMRLKLPTVAASLRQQSSPKNLSAISEKLNSTVWFCGIEDRHPVIYAVHSQIGIGLDSFSKVSVTRFPPYEFPRGSGVIFIGPDSLHGRAFELNPMRLRDVSYLVEEADQIVRAGISDPAGRSGGAVTILHISKDGPRFLARSSSRRQG
jgi:hypothetical protein